MDDDEIETSEAHRAAGAALEYAAREFTACSGKKQANALRVAALRYSRAYAAEARALGLIPGTTKIKT